MTAANLPDFFSLYGLPQCYALDAPDLQTRHHAVQRKVHPDRFATASEREQRMALQWAAHANAAYRVLSCPLQRAQYLCELKGQPVSGEGTAGLSLDFLTQQMSWREDWQILQEKLLSPDAAVCKAAKAQQATLLTEVQAQQTLLETRLGDLLDQQKNYAVAAQTVREGLFIQRFLETLHKN